MSLVLAVAASPGCGDDDGGIDAGDSADGIDSGAGSGGSDASIGGECTEEPCLEPPAEGFQVRSVGTMIQPGEDVEYCEVVQLPGTSGTTYYVNRFESQMTLGSHHLIVGAVEPGSATDNNAQVGERVDCVGPGGFGQDLYEVTGQQVPYHEESFPAGVGRVYFGGQKVIFNYHYFNATDDPLPARAAVNFFTTEESEIQKLAESFGFYFIGLSVPPRDPDTGEPGTASYDLECFFDTDVMVHKLTRHTHRWGQDFPVSFAGGPRDGELIYTSPNYENPDHVFSEPVLVPAGQGFHFQCNYVNDTDRTLTFAENATDEMCILFGTIYSPTSREVPGNEGCFEFTETP